MKKLKIAALGISALGLAALPVAGVFAAETGPVLSQTDTITLTINSVCTLGTVSSGSATATSATTHANSTTSGVGTWGDSNNTLAVTMQPGTSDANVGSTTLTVRCNNAAGYSISASSTDAELSNSAANKTATDIKSAANYGTNKTAADGASYWNFKLTNPSGMTVQGSYGDASAIPTTSAKVAEKTSAGNIGDGESVTITYGIGLTNAQESGTYSGSVTYTLAQLDSSPAQTNNQSNDQTQQNNDQTQQDQNNPTPEPEQVKSAPTPKLAQSAPKQTSSTSGGTTTNTTTNTTTTNNNDTTTEPNAEEENANALGVETSSISTTETPVENQSNTGLIVTAMIVGVAAVSGGTALYIKNRKDEA